MTKEMNEIVVVDAINIALFEIIKTVKDPTLDGDGQAGPKKYKHVTLKNLIKTIEPYFHSRDLVIAQPVVSMVIGGVCSVGIKTIVKHKDGSELVIGEMLAPVGGVNNGKEAGAWLTYARRHSLMAYLGLVGDPDNDGVESDIAEAYDNVMNEMPYDEAKKTGFKEKTREWIKANLRQDETFNLGEAYFEIIKIGYSNGVSLVDEKVVEAAKNGDLAYLRRVVKENS